MERLKNIAIGMAIASMGVMAGSFLPHQKDICRTRLKIQYYYQGKVVATQHREIEMLTHFKALNHFTDTAYTNAHDSVIQVKHGEYANLGLIDDVIYTAEKY